jgi:hemicentin
MSTTPAMDAIVIEQGNSLDLNCSATGCPTPNITWTKTGVEAPLVAGIGQVLLHNFTSVQKEDTGHYQCTVDNGIEGSPINKTIYVNVTCE